MPREDRQQRQRLDPDTRRREILAAAREAFAAMPYDGVQVVAIAAAAGGSEALVFKYFGSKADLYAAVVEQGVADLEQRRAAALATLPEGVPVRDRVRAELVVYLDHVAASIGWAAALAAPASEPSAAQAIRRRARADYVTQLAALLGTRGWLRHDYTLWGYVGFLDGACGEWARRGCLAAERDSLVEAALGALEGALGDWRA